MMVTTITDLMRPLVDEDLDDLPDSEERYEIINGELVVTPRPVPQHQQLSGRLYRQFAAVVEDGGIGLVYTSPIRVRLTPHDVVDPDLCVLTVAQRDVVTDRLIDAAPLLIVEILSPSTQRVDLISKMALYERAGVAEYWVVDPMARTVNVHVLREGTYSLAANEDGFARSRAIPGIAMNAAALSVDLW